MATITDYIDLIPLATAKTYLRIDEDITEADDEIILMVNSACELIEKYTQVYLKPQDLDFYFNTRNCSRVYAYPINSIELPVDEDDVTVTVKQLYSIYEPNTTDLDYITLNVGYNDSDNVKSIFSQAVLETVKLWFYGSETETIMKGYIPSSVMAILSSERRFIF